MLSPKKLPYFFERSLQATPQVLYHYTSASALLNICTTGRLWASDIRYLNDFSERQHFFSCASAALEKQIQALDSDRDDERKVLQEVVRSLRTEDRHDDFVACFSEVPDSLSQWRGYCPDLTGVCIGFSAQALRTQWIYRPSEESAFVGASLCKVIYLPAPDAADMTPYVESAIEMASSVTGMRGFQGQELTGAAVIRATLGIFASEFKHNSFSEEREWRVVLSKPHKPMPGQLLRVGRSTVIPYVEVELGLDLKRNRMSEPLIKEVIVGPSPNAQLTANSIRRFFEIRGEAVAITNSVIPYRNW